MTEQQDWLKILESTLESTQKEFDKFWDEVLTTFQETNSNLNNIKEILEEIVLEIEDNLSRDFEEFLEDVKTFLEFLSLFDLEDDDQQENNYNEGESQVGFRSDSAWENPFYTEFQEPKIEPNPNQYPACIGCSNYHGRIYNGNLLVCAMHPYGWDDENCPDFVSE